MPENFDWMILLSPFFIIGMACLPFLIAAVVVPPLETFMRWFEDD
jgi:hypothetical protein